MPNPQYYRITNNDKFIGFMRIVTEYLPAGENVWSLAKPDHDEKIKLGQKPVGIESLKRVKFTK